MKFRSRAGERFPSEPKCFCFAKRILTLVLELKNNNNNKNLYMLIHYVVKTIAKVAIWNAPVCIPLLLVQVVSVVRPSMKGNLNLRVCPQQC